MDSKEIVKLRKQLKFTQQNLADKLGVHRVTVAKWETGEARPSKLAIRELQRLMRKNNAHNDGKAGASREAK